MELRNELSKSIKIIFVSFFFQLFNYNYSHEMFSYRIKSLVKGDKTEKSYLLLSS